MRANIDVGDVIGRAFAIYKENAVILIVAALIVFAVSAVAVVLLPGVLAIIALAITVILATFYQGMVVELVRDVQDGRRDHTLGELFKSVSPVALPLFVVAVLAGLGIAIGFILLIIPGLILLTIWAVVAPVVVLEKPGIGRTFGRSRELVRDNGWRVFAVIVLVFLITIVFGFVIGIIGAIFGDVGNAIGQLLANALTAPISALVAAVLYFRLREAKGEAAGLESGPAPAQDAFGREAEPGTPAGA